MESLLLTIKFLLGESTAPLIVPVPWHLATVMGVLGLAAGVGLHRILDVFYGIHRVRAHQDFVLSWMSQVMLWVGVIVMIMAYLIGTQGDALVKSVLGEPAAFSTAGKIGEILLEPVFGPVEADETNSTETRSRGQLNDLLLTVTAAELRQGIKAHLAQAYAAMDQRKQMETSTVEHGLPPAGSDEGLPQEPNQKLGETKPSLELLAVALHWVGTVEQEWPAEMPVPKENISSMGTRLSPHQESPEVQPDEDSASPNPPSEATTEGSKSPESQTKEDTATQDPAESTGTVTGKATDETPEATGKTTEESAEKDPTQESPNPFARQDPAGKEEEPDEFPLPLFLVALVAEIPDDAMLTRHDWEHIAGTRFLEWIIKPMMLWQIQYSAVLLAVVTLAGLILYFLFLRYLRIWLNSVLEFDPIPRHYPKTPPR